MNPKSRELLSEQIRITCDPDLYPFKDTTEIEPLDEVIGQKRAVQAIQFGLEMKSPGYNIFVTGQEGTGKASIVGELLRKHAVGLKTPGDWCMVNNFKDEFRPRPISLPPGSALRFSKRMNRFIEDLKIRLPKEFERQSYLDKLAEIHSRLDALKQELFERLERQAKAKNLKISRTPSGYQTVPVVDDQPIDAEAFQNLPEERRKVIEADAKQLQIELQQTLREVGKSNHASQKEVEKLMEAVAMFIVKDRLEILREDFSNCPDVLDYLMEVQADIVENVGSFLKALDPSTEADREPLADMRSTFRKYQVNVLVERKPDSGAPVIFELNPTYQNVFAQIEKRAFMGALATDFMMVQAGSLLQANGGFLALEIDSLLMNPMVWEALKRALQNKQLFIEEPPSGVGISAASMRPEPVPLDVKVVLIGDYETFQMLQNFDSKFNKIFRVRADFDYETMRSEESIQQYARFVAKICKQEGLRPFSPRGVAAVVEHGETIAASQKKLSLRFGPILNIVKEADYWAAKEAAGIVEGVHVQRAFEEYRFRYNLYEEKMQDSVVDDTVMIDVQGEVVGQVNALAVYQMGDFYFGRPSRITAETYMGKRGLINIEREARLSGSTHDKGVLILSGYLGRTFAQTHPLNLSISITFEQSYGGIDGDSASSTELYAILSSLSGMPIKQGIAVTGSVNQKGKIQAIGGVNHKIEGFYDVCNAKGLTGEQGVLIPRANVQNLMLKKEVVDAVAEGLFHIYPVSTIEEGIEVLTGVPAGLPDEMGGFPEGTVFNAVRLKLRHYLEQAYRLKKELDDLY